MIAVPLNNSEILRQRDATAVVFQIVRPQSVRLNGLLALCVIFQTAPFKE